MTANPLQRLKELERETTNRKKIVADQALDIGMLKDVAVTPGPSPVRLYKQWGTAPWCGSDEPAARSTVRPTTLDATLRGHSIGEQDRLLAAITTIIRRWPRYGSPRITEMLRTRGRRVDHTRVKRIWRSEGLQIPRKQRTRHRVRCSETSIASAASADRIARRRTIS